MRDECEDRAEGVHQHDREPRGERVVRREAEATEHGRKVGGEPEEDSGNQRQHPGAAGVHQGRVDHEDRDAQHDVLCPLAVTEHSAELGIDEHDQECEGRSGGHRRPQLGERRPVRAADEIGCRPAD
jgi:hypothetical protein